MFTMNKIILMLALFGSSMACAMNQHRVSRVMYQSHKDLCKAVLNENVDIVLETSHRKQEVPTVATVSHVTGYSKYDADGTVAHVRESDTNDTVQVFGKKTIPLTLTAGEMVHLIRATTTSEQRLLCSYLCLCAAAEDPDYYNDMAIEYKHTKQPLSWKQQLNPLGTDPVEEIISNGQRDILERRNAFSLASLNEVPEDTEELKAVKERKDYEAFVKNKVTPKKQKELSEEEMQRKNSEQSAIVTKIEKAVYSRVFSDSNEELPTTAWGRVTSFGKNNVYAIGVVTATIGCATYLYNFFAFKKAQQLMEDEDSWMNWTSLTAAQFPLVPKDQLAKLLVYSVFQKYDPAGDDIERVFGMFIKDIKKEISSLKPFVKRASFLKKAYVGKLFGIQNEHVAESQEKLNKLLFLRDFYMHEMKAQPEEKTVS